MSLPRARCASHNDAGCVSPMLVVLLWVAGLLVVALVDVGGYLVAASRAQAAADAAALAAVVPDVRPSSEASRVAVAAGATLEECRCRRGSGVASVQVSVEVPGLVIPSLGAARVTARSDAQLVRW